MTDPAGAAQCDRVHHLRDVRCARIRGHEGAHRGTDLEHYGGVVSWDRSPYERELDDGVELLEGTLEATAAPREVTAAAAAACVLLWILAVLAATAGPAWVIAAWQAVS